MRRRHGPGDRVALLEEACGALIIAEAAAMVGAVEQAGRSWARLVDLAGMLGIPCPPPPAELAAQRDVWAEAAGLYHPAGRCWPSDGHWVHQCYRRQ